MNWLSIVAIEVIALLFIVLGAIVFLTWQRKKRLSSEVEQLIDVAQNTINERKQWLTQYLHTKYQLKDEQLATVCEQLISAEKHYLQAFVKQQLEQGSLVSLHIELIALLDQYLKVLPDAAVSKPQYTDAVIPSPAAPTATAVPVSAMAAASAEFMEVPDDELDKTDAAATEPESDWNDTFAEEAEASNNTAPSGDTSVQAPDDLSPEIDEEPDPDWGDAFSEADAFADEASADKVAEPLDILAEDQDVEPDWSDAFAEADDFGEIDVPEIDPAQPLDILSSKPVADLVQSPEEDEDSDWDLAFAETDEATKS